MREHFWDRMEERTLETITALTHNKLPEIIRYSVHITNSCNMNCSFCNDHKGGTIMPKYLFVDLCHRAGKKGIIHITGGEPMTVPWLEDEIIRWQDITRFVLNTNLLILPRQETLEAIYRLKTSLDNYEYSERREHYSPEIITNIKKVTKYVKYTSICFTATHQNAKRLKGFIQFCQREFPQLYSLSVSFYKGANSALTLDNNDIAILFASADYLDSISKQIFLDTHSIKGNYFPENLEIPCYLSMTERLYDEKGEEYYCSHLYRDHVKSPGKPGKDKHCITGCNARFNKYNQQVHRALAIKEYEKQKGLALEP